MNRKIVRQLHRSTQAWRAYICSESNWYVFLKFSSYIKQQGLIYRECAILKDFTDICHEAITEGLNI